VVGLTSRGHAVVPGTLEGGGYPCAPRGPYHPGGATFDITRHVIRTAPPERIVGTARQMIAPQLIEHRLRAGTPQRQLGLNPSGQQLLGFRDQSLEP
jgi:hypothetical protein